MKKFKLVACIMMLAFVTSYAQQNQRPTPEQRTEKELNWMVTELKISTEQKEKVKTIFSEYNKKMTEMREAGNRDREKFRTLNEERGEQLKKVLTKEQYDAYTKHRDEMRQQRRQRSPNQ